MTGQKKHNHTIDVIKGIAIILVMITHYEWTEDQRKIFVFPFIINMAIPIFMVITGYVYSLSLQKNGVKHLEDAYPRCMILRRVVRYTLPVVVVVLWELVDPHFSINLDLLEKIRWMIDGTIGKGSYYYPVMMQLIFVFPLIYFLIEKMREKGLLVAFIANAVYEILVWAYGIPTGSFRLLVFRYVFLIAAGVHAYMGYRLSLGLGVLMTTSGAAFISGIVYFGYEPRILNKDWVKGNFISSMLIIPLMILLLQRSKEGGVHLLPLEIIGKASYHIFLAQMVYYAGYYTVLQDRVSTWQGHLIAGIIISLTIGVVFYYIDKPIQDWLESLISRHSMREKESA